MKTLHTKSPCCRGKTYRFGNRKRQCAVCGKTWTVRSKRRGRKSYRVNKELLRRVMLERRTLDQEMRKSYPSLPALRYRFRKSIEWISRQSREYEPWADQLILLADALWFRLKKEYWTLYLMALKPVDDNQALLLDPVLLAGKEGYENWQAALNTLPKEAEERITTFVSDNFRAAKRIAREHCWVHQLCHFHLLAQLQSRRGKRKRGVRSRNTREEIYQHIRQALEAPEGQQLKVLLACLKRSSSSSDCPRKLQMIANEFLRSIDWYRAYLRYPELNLPTTTSAIESFGQVVRRTTRTINTPKGLYLWVVALARLRSKITCNGKNFQQN